MTCLLLGEWLPENIKQRQLFTGQVYMYVLSFSPCQLNRSFPISFFISLLSLADAYFCRPSTESSKQQLVPRITAHLSSLQWACLWSFVFCCLRFYRLLTMGFSLLWLSERHVRILKHSQCQTTHQSTKRKTMTSGVRYISVKTQIVRYLLHCQPQFT